MTRFVVAFALVGTLLSCLDDAMIFLASLRDPGPVLARAMTMMLNRTVPSVPCLQDVRR
jgi:hypothetical protein